MNIYKIASTRDVGIGTSKISVYSFLCNLDEKHRI